MSKGGGDFGAVKILTDSLPQISVYVGLCLVFSLPVQQTMWRSLFAHRRASSSAIRMALLKILFVAQAVVLGALTNDVLFQLCTAPTVTPKVSGLWMTPVTLICGAVVTLTHSSAAMTQHTLLSMMVACIPSLALLQAKQPPSTLVKPTIEVLMAGMYAISIAAVFWEDIKEFIEDRNIKLPFDLFHLTVKPKSRDSNSSISTTSTTSLPPHRH